MTNQSRQDRSFGSSESCRQGGGAAFLHPKMLKGTAGGNPAAVLNAGRGSWGF